MFIFLLVMELMSGIFQTVVKAITWGYDQLLQPQMFVSVYEELLLKFPAENTILSPFFISTSK